MRCSVFRSLVAVVGMLVVGVVLLKRSLSGDEKCCAEDDESAGGEVRPIKVNCPCGPRRPPSARRRSRTTRGANNKRN